MFSAICVYTFIHLQIWKVRAHKGKNFSLEKPQHWNYLFTDEWSPKMYAYKQNLSREHSVAGFCCSCLEVAVSVPCLRLGLSVTEG